MSIITLRQRIHSIEICELVPLHRPILLTLEIYGIYLQLHYVKHCVQFSRGNFITIILRQKLRLNCPEYVL